MASSWLATVLLFVSCASISAASHIRRHDHTHAVRALLPAAWHHTDNHPVHALFKRGDMANDGVQYAEVGSPTWSAAFPTNTPDANAMPQAWKDALAAAVKAGKIPNIAPSKDTPNQSPTYNGDPNGLEICSATYKCRIDGDVWDAPDGVFGASFDDGPLPASDKLYPFLQQNNISATHFFIGINIVQNWKVFNYAYDALHGDIAVHTWTHPYMTTLSNEDVVAQLAWTMEVIHNSTGGRVPRFWRPPYGDTDKRVSAIAKEVLGLTTVIWNQDSEDWSMPTGTTPDKIHAQFQGWAAGPKTPGLVILEHELNDATVQVFIDNFPLIKSNGWNVVSIAQMDKLNQPYQNAVGTVGAVTLKNIVPDVAPVVDTTSSGGTDSSSGAPAPSTDAQGQTSTSSSGRSHGGLAWDPAGDVQHGHRDVHLRGMYS
ncbi:hypothetical protein EWM64_g3396 [Hericium alpestre]|uniref:chitin deacetylase n=1 Tax=Hericium alpestre TaxID=135208 RepID=A0A4Z0A0F8_9AGAM|nr:hypothetical protein EWM64_g3396 [Hericium alpestre]